MLELLRSLVVAGVGLEVRQGALALTAPVAHRPDPAVMAQVRAHGAELRAAVDDRVLRRLWHVPDGQDLGPGLRVILAWLSLERAAFSAEDYHAWLTAKSAHVDAGAPRYVADILATESVARRKLVAVASESAVVQEAAA